MVPHGLPLPVTLMLIPIEIMGMLVRPFALTMRLAANMTGGHIAILAILSFVFIFAELFGQASSASASAWCCRCRWRSASRRSRSSSSWSRHTCSRCCRPCSSAWPFTLITEPTSRRRTTERRMEGFALAYMGAGIGLGLAVIGAGLGIGRLAAGAAEAIGRQPSATAQITGAVQPAALPARRRRDSGRGVRAADRAAEVDAGYRKDVRDEQPAGPARSRALHLDHRRRSWSWWGCWRSSPGGRCSRRSSARQDAIRKSLDDAQQAKQELERLHVESAAASSRRRAPRPRRSSRARGPTPTGSARS